MLWVSTRVHTDVLLRLLAREAARAPAEAGEVKTAAPRAKAPRPGMHHRELGMLERRGALGADGAASGLRRGFRAHAARDADSAPSHSTAARARALRKVRREGWN